MRHPLIRQRCEGFDIRLKILDGRGFGVRHQVFDDRGGEGLVFDLVRGGLARRGGLAVEKLDFVVQAVLKGAEVSFAGSGFDQGEQVREEVALGKVGGGGHGVSPFVKRFFIFSRWRACRFPYCAYIIAHFCVPVKGFSEIFSDFFVRGLSKVG